MQLKNPKEFNRLKSISRSALDNAVKATTGTSQSYFSRLPSAQKNEVFYSVLKGTGKSSPKFNAKVKWMSSFGRVLIVVSIAYSGYEIYDSSNREKEFYRQGISISSGVAGGALGGAAAAGICGPGSPVCAIVGVVIGSVAGGYGAYKLLEAYDDELEAFTTWTVF